MIHNLPRLVSNEQRPGALIWTELRKPLTDKPMLSAIGAAIALVIAVEVMPGIDHAATAMGLTAALALIGVSVTSGLLSAERAQRRSSSFFPRPLSLGFVGAVTVVGFVYCLVFGVIVLCFKSAWILDGPMALAGIILGASFASALGAALGMTVRRRGALNTWSLCLFCVLLVPVSLCCADTLPASVSSVFSVIPTVAMAKILRAALTGNPGETPLPTDAGLLIASTALLLAMSTQRALARLRSFYRH